VTSRLTCYHSHARLATFRTIRPNVIYYTTTGGGPSSRPTVRQLQHITAPLTELPDVLVVAALRQPRIPRSRTLNRRLSLRELRLTLEALGRCNAFIRSHVSISSSSSSSSTCRRLTNQRVQCQIPYIQAAEDIIFRILKRRGQFATHPHLWLEIIHQGLAFTLFERLHQVQSIRHTRCTYGSLHEFLLKFGPIAKRTTHEPVLSRGFYMSAHRAGIAR